MRTFLIRFLIGNGGSSVLCMQTKFDNIDSKFWIRTRVLPALKFSRMSKVNSACLCSIAYVHVELMLVKSRAAGKLCIQIDTDNCTSSSIYPFTFLSRACTILQFPCKSTQIQCGKWSLIPQEKCVPKRKRASEREMTYDRHCKTGKNDSGFKIISHIQRIFCDISASSFLFSHSASSRWADKVEGNDQPFFTQFYLCPSHLPATITYYPAWLGAKSKKLSRSHLAPHQVSKCCSRRNSHLSSHVVFPYAGHDTKHIIKEMTI